MTTLNHPNTKGLCGPNVANKLEQGFKYFTTCCNNVCISGSLLSYFSFAKEKRKIIYPAGKIWNPSGFLKGTIHKTNNNWTLTSIPLLWFKNGLAIVKKMLLFNVFLYLVLVNLFVLLDGFVLFSWWWFVLFSCWFCLFVFIYLVVCSFTSL